MRETAGYQYQHGFSALHPEAMYHEAARRQKASKTMAVIADYLRRSGKRSHDLTLLDIGCSTGYLSRHYAPYFRQVTGIDIDVAAVEHAQRTQTDANLEFLVRDSMDTGFPDAAYDAVTCTHIYEHVPDARRLLSEIHRILKPGGFCYFAAGNRIKFMEAHYHLPLLSVIPKKLAHFYVRCAGKATSYHETHYSLWGLRRLVGDFHVHDYTGAIVRDPVKYHATEMVQPGTLKQMISRLVLQTAYWACPTYIWILEKPAAHRRNTAV